MAPSERIDELIDAAFEDFRHAPGLIVDLRGNPGGSVSVAASFRDPLPRLTAASPLEQRPNPVRSDAVPDPFTTGPR